MVVSAVGKDRPEVLRDLTKIIQESGCNLVESRMTALGSEFAMLLLISGNWNNITRLEGAFPKVEQRLGVSTTVCRTSEREPRHDLAPYAVDVVCLDQPGIIHNLSNFFSERRVGIADLTARSYLAAHTGAPMLSVQMAVNIPVDTHIAALREEFMDFCDQFNLDAVMEPIKN